MSAVGFATTHSLVDLLDELPLPRARQLTAEAVIAADNSLAPIQDAQELQEIAAIIAPAIHMARLSSDLDRLRFKDPNPVIKHHHTAASPLMSVIVSHHQQFQDIISVPPYQIQPQVVPHHLQQQAQHPRQTQQLQQPLPQQQPPQLQQIPSQQQQHHLSPLHPQPTLHHPLQQMQQQQQQISPHHQNVHQHHHQQQPLPHLVTHHIPLQPTHLHHQQQHQMQAHVNSMHNQQQQMMQSQNQMHYQNQQTQGSHGGRVSFPPHPQAQTMPLTPSSIHTLQESVAPSIPQIQPTSTTKSSRKPISAANSNSIKPPREKKQALDRSIKIEKSAKLPKVSKVETKKEKSTIKESLNPNEFEDFLSDIIGKNMDQLSFSELTYLVRATAKFKRSKKMSKIEIGKLTGLLTYLTTHILGMHEIEHSCDYAVIALNIMTSSGMDSRVYLEESVEAIIALMNNALLRITDIAPKKSNKQEDRNSSKYEPLDKQNLLMLTTKCSEILSLINELLIARNEATLNDSLVLSTSRAALTAFFSMDTLNSSNELQLNALNVITAIFASYKAHQTVILDELIHSIARLPTTKRNRVQYQIGTNNRSSSESISIFTALIMQLIQSLFTIRKNSNKSDKSNSSNSNEAKDTQEYERILKSQYTTALRVSYAFVSSFLRRCCGVDKKDDCDYRVLFDTFVDDLMTCLYKPNWSSAQLLTHVLIKLLISNINPPVGKKNQQLPTNQTLKLASIEHLGTICARLVKENSMLPKFKDEISKALDAINLSSPLSTSVKASLRSSKRMNNLQNKSIKRKTIHILEDSDTEEENGDAEEDIDGNHDIEDNLEEGILKIEEEHRFWLALLTFCHREKGISKCGRNIFCAIWLKELERRAAYIYESNNPPSLGNTSVSEDDTSNDPMLSNNMKQYSNHHSSNDETHNQHPIGPSVEELQSQFRREFFRLISLSSKRSISDENNINLETTSDMITGNDRSVTPETADDIAIIDETTAENVIKILDLSLTTTQRLIDAALSHIVAALSSTSNTNIRSRAMKSLSHVLNDAPQDCASRLLVRDDLQKAIGTSLLDQSASVRESTVELIGRFILNSKSEALIDKYYEMITVRIMDSGVSVRKRVIKILRDICLTYPSYSRVPEICSIMIKRINDEGEGIRRLVSDTFTSMWFKEEKTQDAIVTKVTCITHVVATVWSRILAETLGKNIGSESHFEWLHQLLSSLLLIKPATDDPNQAARRKSKGEISEEVEVLPQTVSNVKQALSASTQIISVLISDKLSNVYQDSTSRADCLAAMTALWAFAKISPLLLEHHIDFFQSYLSIEVRSSFDLLIQEKVIQIIELVLPTISNPSLTTLKTIEQDLAKLILGIGGIRVIPVSVSCFSEIIHKHTQNYQLANDIFKRYFQLIRMYGNNPPDNRTSSFLRALYTCGLLVKHFSIRERDELYCVYVSFVEHGIDRMKERKAAWQHHQRNIMTMDERILLKSLEGLGFMFERSPQLMLKPETEMLYKYFMKQAVNIKQMDSAMPSICVLTNLKNYLQDEVTQEIKSASCIDWSRENLKEMNSTRQEDANSTQSSVIQRYLTDMLSCALSSDLEIRKAAIKLIHSVHNGGNISPLSIIPSLIALSTDEDSTIRIRAEHVLQEIERKYNNFVNMKSKQGILESFILNRKKRGYQRSTSKPNQSDLPETSQKTNNNGDPVNISAKLSTLYSLMATNRQSRRAFINALLKYFDLQTLSSAPNILSINEADSRFVLSTCGGSDILQYISDNIIFLPFTVLDEPFFLIHQIDITLSNLVSHTVSQFCDFGNGADEFIEQLPVSILQVKDLVGSLRRCMLLLHCRRTIWDLYGITEQKFEEYTPNESAKVTDKPTHRRQIDESQLESLLRAPETTVHFESEPFLKSMYSSIFGDDDIEDMQILEQCAPTREQLKLEYKRFSKMMTE